MSLLWARVASESGRQPVESFGLKRDEEPPQGPWGRGPTSESAWHHADVDEVPIDHTLRSTETTLDPDRVAHYAKKGWRSLPRISREGDNHYIVDGHHRVAAAIQRGDTSFTARVHDGDVG